MKTFFPFIKPSPWVKTACATQFLKTLKERVALLLCLDKYLLTIILSFLLIICPVSLIAGQSPSALTSLTAANSSPVVVPQRVVASFAPAFRFASQTIAEDTLWQGAIQVDGMVTIAAQATLTIMPGTVVRFGADSGLLVLGRVVAKGTAELPVLLTSYYLQPAPADWYGIVLTGTAKKNIFDHLKLQGAETAIYSRSSSFVLNHLSVDNSSVALKLVDSIVELKEVQISDCPTGISAVKSEVELESVIIDKSEIGLTVTSSSLSTDKLIVSLSSQSALIAEKSQLKVEKSVFSNNARGAVITDCGGSFTGSKFIANSETAVVMSSSPLRFNANLVSGSKVGMQLNDNLPSVWGNSIYANSSYNLFYSGDEHVYLGGNWLGTSNGGFVSDTVFSKRPGAIRLLPLLATNPWKDLQKDY